MRGYPYQRLADGMPIPPCDAGSFKRRFITGAPTPTKPRQARAHTHAVGQAPMLPSVLRSLMGHGGVKLTRGGRMYCVLTHGRKRQKHPPADS